MFSILLIHSLQMLHSSEIALQAVIVSKQKGVSLLPVYDA